MIRTLSQGALALSAIAAVAATAWIAARPPVVARPRVATVARAETRDGVSDSRRDAAASCAECHATEFEAWSDSPHARTLVATLGASARLLADAEVGANDLGRFIVEDGDLWLESDRIDDPIRIDWIFGSGLHARTPVSTWLDPDGRTVMLEHGLSWYPPGFIAATLGSEAPLARAGVQACGKLLDPETTRACFGCHATHVPERDGRVDEARVTAGVGCVRCHADGERHAAAHRSGVADPTAAPSHALSPLASIRSCGECHRRDDQLPREDLRPDNLLLVRFAPVGLSQSACFTRQAERRLDCLTCHDPHASADRRPLATAERCLSCHGSSGPHPECPSAPATSDCTACHMPKVEVQPHLRFTDHWIRVRDADARTAGKP